MTAAILRQYGLGLAEVIVAAAQAEGLELAIAAAVIEKESGGRNVWGSDGVQTGGTYIKGAPVTREAYLAYRTAMKAGRIGRQGVGPAQCTSAQYQDTADALGGCWDPMANMRAGFRGLKALTSRYGVRDGARRYNGSGPAAERYADDFMTRYQRWRSRLACAPVTPPQEDDLTEEERALLIETNTLCKAMLQQFSGSPKLGEWPGHETWPGGTNERLSLLDYGRRANVETRQLVYMVDALRREVAELRAKFNV